jgi:parvulin-like peptidyl-prolyl isomerase
VRFAALLKRNAGLRALVARDVRIDEVGIANAFDMLHGTKRVARLAVLTSLPDAERFIADVQAGRSFIDLAVERSLDDGAARGGLLAPIARRDPSYPEGLRAAIYATKVGDISAPILENGRFFVVTVMEERPSDGTTLESARARCEEVVRRSQERLLMDALARELSELKGVTVFDRSFDPPNK